MTGSGTKTDPYIVDNWEDFLIAAASSYDVKYIEFDKDAENKVIDLTDVVVEKMTLARATINGNGWTIKNFHAKEINEPIFNVSQIMHQNYTYFNNLNFVDFFVANSDLFGKGIRLSDAFFSGVIYSDTAVRSFFYGGYNTATNCSLNLHFYKNSSLVTEPQSVPALFKNCVLQLGGQSNVPMTSEYPYNSTFSPVCSFSSCRIFGINPFTKFGMILHSELTIVDVEIDNDVVISTEPQYFIILNKDKVDSSIEIPEGVFQATAEQINNPNYYVSLGFPIGVD